MEDQLNFIEPIDAELFELITLIQQEEISHLTHAQRHITISGLHVDFLYKLVAFMTDMLIYLSTWGDSVKMKNGLKNAKNNNISGE